MKLLYTILLFFLGLFPLQAQILTIIEDTSSGKDTIPAVRNQIVDINSALEVHVSKDSLIKTIKERFPNLGAQVDLQEKIVLLEQALERQDVILTTLKQEVVSAESRTEFYNAVLQFYTLVVDSPIENEVELLLEEHIRLYGGEDRSEAPTSIEYLMTELNSKVIDLKSGIKATEDEKILISLVGFKRDKSGGGRIHIKNFDLYEDLEYVTIPRWVTSLSESQKQQLDDLAKKAKENNEKMVSVFESLKEQIALNFPDLSCIEDLHDSVKEMLADTQLQAALTADLKEMARSLASDLDAFITLSELLQTNIRQWEIQTPFAIGDAVKELVTQLKAFEFKMGSFANLAEEIARLQAWNTNFQSDFSDCYRSLEGEVLALRNGIAILLNQQVNYIANKEIGEEVLAFSVSNIPKIGYINLKGTGSRTDGDEIVLEVLLRIPSETEGIPEKRFTLEERNIVMYMVGVHTEVAVGMILADPFSDDGKGVDPSRKHFFVPAASLLLKFGSRNATFYNEFVDLGFGLNFAAPDFDTDGVPEFGTGMIVTAFRDILSVGINYNVTLDTPYWFFGVNLPFNIPGIPINTVKTN